MVLRSANRIEDRFSSFFIYASAKPGFGRPLVGERVLSPLHREGHFSKHTESKPPESPELKEKA